MHNSRGIIALDLDGTLLDSDKNLSQKNFAALKRAAELGYEIVPTTGRFYDGMPENIRSLPFVRYAITINGAEVKDLETGSVLYQAEMPYLQAAQLMEYFDPHPVIYDCYMNSAGWMTGAMKEKIDETVDSPHYRKMLHELRHPVPELKAFLRDRKQDVQKVQFFARDEALRLRLMAELPEKFENICVSSSAPQNVEINHKNANKGQALMALASHLGIPRENTLSFGDGLNDLSMLRDAGIGIAMKNACPEALEIADWITVSNDEDGVALGIEKFCF